ncbi:MAG: hypothetical protein QXQ43_04125 [Nitrososphaerota archaeon]
MRENTITFWDEKGAPIMSIVLHVAVPPECNIIEEIDEEANKNIKKILKKYKLNPNNTSFEYASINFES